MLATPLARAVPPHGHWRMREADRKPKRSQLGVSASSRSCFGVRITGPSGWSFSNTNGDMDGGEEFLTDSGGQRMFSGTDALGDLCDYTELEPRGVCRQRTLPKVRETTSPNL